MPKLQLSFACGLYDRMQPLYTGEVKPDGIDLNFIAIDQPRPIFDRMCGGQEFDASEYSSFGIHAGFSPATSARSSPSRCSRRSRFRTATSPSTRVGHQVAQGSRRQARRRPLYTKTAAIFISGMLHHEYDVDMSKIHWVQGAINHVGTHGQPGPAAPQEDRHRERRSKKSLSDCSPTARSTRLCGTSLPDEAQSRHRAAVPELRRGREGLLQAHGHLPIMHLVAIRRASTSDIRSSRRAFTRPSCKSKKIALQKLINPARCAT